MAAIKFNTLTFDVKDLLLICGLVAGYFIAHCLDAVDPNHVKKAAENDQRN